MRNFIQLRDGIGYATIIVPDGEPDHTVTPDHTTAIEVFTDNPDQFLNKKYDEATKSWSEAELIWYADIDSQGRLIEFRKTYFMHEADGKPILTPEVKPDWRWVDGAWVKPEIIEAVQYSIAAPPTAEEVEEGKRLIEENPLHK